MSESETDMQEICRVCLERSSRMYPLVGPILNVEMNISAMITYCTSIELTLDEDLPNKVCIPCFRTIRIAYNFICQFKETNQKLLKEREQVGIKEEPTPQIEFDFDDLGSNIHEEIILDDFNEEEVEEEKIIITCISETLDNETDVELNPSSLNETSEVENDTPEATEPAEESKAPVDKICGALRKRTTKNYICPMCPRGYRSFESGFVPHLSTFHSDEILKCSNCPIDTLFNMETYIQHYKRVHLYQCPICHRSLRRKSSLYYHMKVHTANKPYKCSFENCNKSFLTSWSLNKHMNTHSDTIKYICSKCGSKFNTYDTFRYHQKTHDGNRNHLCPECGRSFLQSVHLKYHMWKHTGVKQFHCDKCTKSYTSVTQLKKHIRKYCGAVKTELAC